MKAFFLISFFALAVTSCNKQRVYLCTTLEYPFNNAIYSTHTFSDKELGKYLRINSIDVDGLPDLLSKGERYVRCTIKD